MSSDEAIANMIYRKLLEGNRTPQWIAGYFGLGCDYTKQIFYSLEKEGRITCVFNDAYAAKDRSLTCCFCHVPCESLAALKEHSATCPEHPAVQASAGASQPVSSNQDYWVNTVGNTYHPVKYSKHRAVHVSAVKEAIEQTRGTPVCDVIAYLVFWRCLDFDREEMLRTDYASEQEELQQQLAATNAEVERLRRENQQILETSMRVCEVLEVPIDGPNCPAETDPSGRPSDVLLAYVSTLQQSNAELVEVLREVRQEMASHNGYWAASFEGAEASFQIEFDSEIQRIDILLDKHKKKDA